MRKRRLKQLPDDLKKMGYLKLKGEKPGCMLCRTGYGSGYGPVARQTTQ